MKRRILAAVMFCSGLAGPVLAQAPDCSTALTQVEMNDCAAELWKEADARLNQRYKEALAMLREWDRDLPKGEQGGVEALRAAQRAWIPYRDAACKVDGWPMRGGSAEPLLVLGCRKRLTEERISDLENLLSYDEY